MRRLVTALVGLAVIGALFASYYGVHAQEQVGCSLDNPSAARIVACSKIMGGGGLSDGQMASALFNRGAAYDDEHQYKLAIKDYTEVIRLRPDFATAFNARGSAYDEDNQLDNALADYSEAIRLNPDATLAAYAWANRALLEMRHGLLAQSLSDYNEALKKDSQNGWALYGRGIARLRAGDKAGGSADISAANKIDPGIAKSYADIGIRP